MRRRSVRFGWILAAGVVLLALPLSAQASHSWGNYHWARTASAFTIKVIDSMTSDWDGNLDTAMTDWAKSSVLDLTKEAGSDDSRTRKRCSASAGKVRACNAPYGRNGWLGLAQIWASGSHITQATAKMNDSYLASGYTNTNRQHVICQEIGHDWGLDHQDESGADLNTCMDYSNDLGNPSPNQHDYDQLGTIYKHLDSTTTVAPTSATMPAGFANADVHAQANWGAKVAESADGRAAVFVRDFGGGNRVITHVLWAN